MESFNTLSRELGIFATLVVKYLRGRGYTVTIEPTRLGYPYTPTMKGVRQKTESIIEFSNDYDKERMDNWVRYAKSCSTDIRIIYSTCRVLSQETRNLMEARGVGLIVCDAGIVVPQILPRDLSVNVELPPIEEFSRKLKAMLGPIYDQIDNSFWREGFEDACKLVEVGAREYLFKWLGTNRIRLLSEKGTIYKPTKAQISKMTMGRLAEVYSQIISKNLADSQIADALKKLNKDRIGVVHHKNKQSTETRLRKNVGQHMWMIITVLKLLYP